MGTNQSHYNSRDYPDNIEGHNEWMSHLPDDLSITAMSIPGTHNSCGRSGGDMLRCQSWRLRSQLLAGIRFLDIKCRHMYNSLVVDRNHKQINFDDILRTCIIFLDDNPSEFIIIRVREDKKTPAITSRDFKETFLSYLTIYGVHRFLVGCQDPPTLGEARGKIIFIGGQDFGKVCTPYTISLLAENVAGGDTKTTLNKITQHLNSAATNHGEGILYVTYCRGFSSSHYPYRNAYTWNLHLLNYLREQQDAPCHGVIAVDFPGSGLIKEIIDANIMTQTRL